MAKRSQVRKGNLVTYLRFYVIFPIGWKTHTSYFVLFPQDAVSEFFLDFVSFLLRI